MFRYISLCEYYGFRKRKTPFITYFRKEDEDFCNDVISTLIKLCKSFPHVFCYFVNAKKFPVLIEEKYCAFENVYSFRDKRLDRIVPATSYSELFDLYRYVYYSSMEQKYSRGFRAILKQEYGNTIKICYLDKNEPDYDKISQFHKFVINPVARHKYKDSEIKFLSQLKDCRFISSTNYNKNLPDHLEEGKTIPAEFKKEKDKSPIFPEPDIQFRSPSPLNGKNLMIYKYSEKKKRSHSIKKNSF